MLTLKRTEFGGCLTTPLPNPSAVIGQTCCLAVAVVAFNLLCSFTRRLTFPLLLQQTNLNYQSKINCGRLSPIKWMRTTKKKWKIYKQIHSPNPRISREVTMTKLHPIHLIHIQAVRPVQLFLPVLLIHSAQLSLPILRIHPMEQIILIQLTRPVRIWMRFLLKGILHNDPLQAWALSLQLQLSLRKIHQSRR